MTTAVSVMKVTDLDFFKFMVSNSNLEDRDEFDRACNLANKLELRPFLMALKEGSKVCKWELSCICGIRTMMAIALPSVINFSRAAANNFTFPRFTKSIKGKTSSA